MSDPQAQARLRAAYTEALGLLRSGRSATAEVRLRALQTAAPGDVNSLRLLGVALLDQGKTPEALEILERAVSQAPRFTGARIDLARAYREFRRFSEARDILRDVVAAEPSIELAWLCYGDVLVDLGSFADARVAYERARVTDTHCRRIEQARAALVASDRKAAESIFRDILKEDPSHVGALCGLAAVSLAVSRGQDALRLLKHAQRQSAHLPLIWRGLCQAYLDLGRLPEAESAAQFLLKIEGENSKNWVTLGNVYTRMMRQPDALRAFEQAATLNPTEVRLRLSIGHLHKTLGQRAQSERAYKDCLELNPQCGEAYSSLADLKNYVFSEAEISTMQGLIRTGAEDADQAQLHFALGRAFEHTTDYAKAFKHYATGNAQRRKSIPYDIGSFENKSRRVVQFFDSKFFAAHQNSGAKERGPIFVVGLPRSGSTLIEQILASHSQIEGTFELPNILTVVRELDHADARHDGYPETAGNLTDAHFASFGSRYLTETAALRTGRPYFIDKMPNNFSHIGLIQAMLPNAIFIDARRHPMDSCFSTFKQYFAEGQSFSYDLNDLGRYYRCYLQLMDHWDSVLPGKVLHLQYEELVRDPEVHIRRLIAHCGLEFEPACMSFHQTKRAVRTASAEQVRQPLYTTGVGYWRHFETELAPLRESLGDSLDRFAFLDPA
jgi:tetratricopeptide (TPR) repeat protein